MVAYLSSEIQKRYQKLTYTNGMLTAAEALMDESCGVEEVFKEKSLNPHYKSLMEEFLKEVHEVQALELYKAFYAGRLLQSVNTETATAN